jgi:hypothetical protein
MGKHAQLGRGRKIVSVFVATSRRGLSKPLRGQEWRKDLLMSWLFQTCTRLQTSLDRRFLRLGMTVQEASVLLRCVEARKVTPGQLAIVLGRDKGKITRFVDRLESSRLLTRDIDATGGFRPQTHCKGKTGSSGPGISLRQHSKRTLRRNIGKRCPSVRQDAAPAAQECGPGWVSA